MREKKRLLAAILAVLCAAVIALSAVACSGGGGGTGTGGGTNNSGGGGSTDKPPSWSTEGFTIGETKIEDAISDLVGGVLNMAQTASVDMLSAKQPYVSWLIGASVDFNGEKYDLQAGVNYDFNDESSLAMAIKVLSEAGEETASVYFYADNADDGCVYISVSDQKVKIPLPNTGIASMFPLESLGGMKSLVVSALSGSIFTEDDIKFEYKDDSDGKRTSHYIMSIDLRRTLVSVVKQLKNSGEEYKKYYEGACSIINTIFGTDASKIPESSLVIDYTVCDGLRTKVGMGKLDNLKVDFMVDESETKNTVFHGEKFVGVIEINNIQAKATLLGSEYVPVKNSAYFNDFFSYDNGESAVTFVGKAHYINDHSKTYDMEIGFLYDGDVEAGDIIKIVISDPDDEENKVFELLYKDSNANLAYMIDDELTEYNLAIDFDYLLGMLVEHYKTKPKNDVITIASYIVSVIQFDDGYFGFKFNENFFKVFMGLEIEEFEVMLQQAYSGGGTIDLDLESLIRDKAIVIQFDIGHDFISDDIEL